MEDRQFDRLVRQLGQATSRRSALRAILGGAVVAVAGREAMDPHPAGAQCARGGSLCNRAAACCSGTCAWMNVPAGRRQTRVGRCTTPGAPVTCTPTGGANRCLTSMSATWQLCGPVEQAAFGSTCASDADCHLLTPSCGGSDTCFCYTGSNDGNGYQSALPGSCLAIPTTATCP